MSVSRFLSNFATMELEVFGADVKSALELEYADAGIRAGFPSPAQDYLNETIDLNRDLIPHPASTFYGRVVGDSMSEEGIAEGDILVIDKSIEPEDGDLAVCCLDGDFTLKRIKMTRDNKLYLIPSNHRYEPIEVTADNEFMVWGIVLYTIRNNRRRKK